MKRLAIITSAVLLSLPLGADEKKTAEKTKQETALAQQQPAPAQLSTEAPKPTDSPLVAAAKRGAAKRQKSKSKVITNETLDQGGRTAHITTTDSQRQFEFAPPPPPVQPSAEVIANEQAAARRKAEAEAAAAKAKKAEEEKKRQARAAAAMENGELGLQDAPADDAEREPLPPTPPQPQPQER